MKPLAFLLVIILFSVGFFFASSVIPLVELWQMLLLFLLLSMSLFYTLPINLYHSLPKRRFNRQHPEKLPPSFPNGWYAIIESRDLTKGTIKELVAFDRRMVIFRANDGHVGVLDSRCAHLGADLSQGKVIGNSVECPMHGWRYGVDGTCTSIPDYVCGEPVKCPSIPTGACVKAWKVKEINGLVFIWLDAENREPWYEVPDFGITPTGSWISHEISQHIQFLAENGADAAHFDFVHSLQRSLSRFIKSSWKFGSGYETDGALARVDLEFKMYVLGVHVKPFDQTIGVTQIGPGMVHLDVQSLLTGHVQMIQTVLPISKNLQLMTHHLCTPGIRPKIPFLFTGHAVSEDVKVWNNLYPQPKPVLRSSDATISQYRRWYKIFYSENSSLLETASLDW